MATPKFEFPENVVSHDFVIIHPDDVYEINFLLSTTSTDSNREVLHGIYVNGKEKKCYSADGFRASWTTIFNSAIPYENKVIVITDPFGKPVRKINKSGRYCAVELVGQTYPDIKSLIPTRNPLYQYAASRKLMSEVLKEFPPVDDDGHITVFKHYGASQPILVEDLHARGFIQMPMYLDGDVIEKNGSVGKVLTELVRDNLAPVLVKYKDMEDDVPAADVLHDLENLYHNLMWYVSPEALTVSQV